VERLFQLNKEKLLSIPAFAWGFAYWRRIMDFLESTAAWRMARQMTRKAADWLRDIRSKLQFYGSRFARAAHRR
jgi:hypothetical protein